jgi:hypothetical protein
MGAGQAASSTTEELKGIEHGHLPADSEASKMSLQII